MNIKIVTTYTSTNCGSFFQAKALYDFLTSLGHNVSFLDIKNDIFKRYIKGKIKDRDYKGLFFLIVNRVKFIKYYNSLPVSKGVNDDDVIIFGSDTIWDATRELFADPKFYGVKGKYKKKFTYAISVDAADEDTFKKYSEIESEIKKFDNFLVRDFHSKKILDSLIGKECASIVLDPTLLWDEHYYSQFNNLNILPDRNNRYILVYGIISPENQYKVRRLAEVFDFRIISLGFINSFADESVHANPETFVTYFMNAQAIITNMFHGICFSLIFKKNIIISDVVRPKTIDSVSFWNLESRVIGKRDPISIYLDSIDYEKIYNKLSIHKNYSIQKLNSSLKK